MKNQIKNLLMGAIVVLITSCEPKASLPTHDSFVLVDNTSAQGSREDVLTLKGVTDLFVDSKGNQTYGKVTFKEVNNVSQNKERSVCLDPLDDGSTILQNKRLKDHFTERLEVVYKEFVGPCKETNSSTIYIPICKALKQLDKSNANKKTLIILSDMVEFSNNADFYHVPKDSVDLVVGKLEKSYPFPNSSDVEIIVLFQPKNETEDLLFQKVMKIWGKIFDSHGIEYSTSANL